MLIEAIFTLVLGWFAFRWGMRFGRVLLRRGATANDLFKGNTAISLLFLGLYLGLVVLALNVPQMQVFPLQWRIYGMQITWTILRVALLGFCGLAFIVSWKTARSQMIAVVLIGLLGIGGFSSAEAYFLAPIYSELVDNLQPNGVFKQTSMSSCAPSALATVLRRWNMSATEPGVAKLASTSRLGTSMPQLIGAARKLRMDGIELSPTWEQMQRINRPGVLGVWLIDGARKLPHAMALLAMNDQLMAIGDPARGKILIMDRAQFAEIWREEYVPIFRQGETAITGTQAADYLKRSGFLNQSSLKINQEAIQQFQQAMAIKPTGYLDTQTTLLLMGPYLEGVPTLKEYQITR
jgi:predicted double-glycine peptidase